MGEILGTILGIIIIILGILAILRNPKKFLDKMSDWINKHK